MKQNKTEQNTTKYNKNGRREMKKRVFAALMAGVMGTMMFGTTFVSAEAETAELKC